MSGKYHHLCVGGSSANELALCERIHHKHTSTLYNFMPDAPALCVALEAGVLREFYRPSS